MSKVPDTFVEINIQKRNIHYQYSVYTREESNGMYSWYVPGFNMFFSSRTESDGQKRAAAMVKSFFIDYFERQKNFRSFVLELHRLGFRANKLHDLTINKLLTKRIPYATLGYLNGHAFEQFPNSKETVSKGELEMAI